MKIREIMCNYNAEEGKSATESQRSQRKRLTTNCVPKSEFGNERECF